LVGSKGRGARPRGGFSAALVIALVAGFATVAAPAQAGEGGVSAVTPPPPVAPTTGAPERQVFPIRGPHQYWDGFGAGRSHQGADVGATCGTPLVAVGAGKVRFAKYHARAGNYLVLDLKESTFDLVYAHLQETAVVAPGQTVVAGQQIGTVGDTGNASGCHLHFELWEGAYYGGGAPVDPLPFLTSLDNERKRIAKRAANRRNR
jgi:murein DD-endopeptidase MepM/ murein hydrolase activator NlpD